MLINELKAKLKSAAPDGWYLFCGDENFLKRHYLKELRAAILPDESLGAFNHMVAAAGYFQYAAGRIADTSLNASACDVMAGE